MVARVIYSLRDQYWKSRFPSGSSAIIRFGKAAITVCLAMSFSCNMRSAPDLRSDAPEGRNELNENSLPECVVSFMLRLVTLWSIASATLR